MPRISPNLVHVFLHTRTRTNLSLHLVLMYSLPSFVFFSKRSAEFTSVSVFLRHEFHFIRLQICSFALLLRRERKKRKIRFEGIQLKFIVLLLRLRQTGERKRKIQILRETRRQQRHSPFVPSSRVENYSENFSIDEKYFHLNGNFPVYFTLCFSNGTLSLSLVLSSSFATQNLYLEFALRLSRVPLFYRRGASARKI